MHKGGDTERLAVSAGIQEENGLGAAVAGFTGEYYPYICNIPETIYYAWGAQRFWCFDVPPGGTMC